MSGVSFAFPILLRSSHSRLHVVRDVLQAQEADVPLDASKVPPSRFQQRKGSIYSTQGSRDGHVQKNKDRDNTFHETHTKLFGKAKEKVKEAGEKVSHRRKSSSGSKGEAGV